MNQMMKESPHIPTLYPTLLTYLSTCSLFNLLPLRGNKALRACGVVHFQQRYFIIPLRLHKQLVMVLVAVLFCCIAVTFAQYSQYVDTTIGTGGIGYGIGSTPVGAQVPFGAARVSPDTVAFDDIFLPFNHFGGYYYPDSHIRVFSHTQRDMVGSGVTDYGNIGVMAISQPPTSSLVKNYGFRSAYRHDTEVTSPGYYSVVLDDPKVKAEMTATEHVGVHRYTWTYSRNTVPFILLYASHSLTPGACKGAQVTINPSTNMATGWMLNLGSLSSRFGGVTTYFAIQFDTNFETYGTWSDTDIYKTETFANGTDIGVYFGFDTKVTNVTFRVAISFISIEQALQNLEQEAPQSQSFDDVSSAAGQIWEQALSIIEVHNPEKESKDNLVKFYTALYHAMLAPTIFSEVGGSYLGFDRKVHQVVEGQSNYYTDMSIWDVHRTQFPLLALLAPSRFGDIIQSLVEMFEQGGDLPKWPLANGYTGCMIGTHADIAISDAYWKGIRNFDLNTSYAAVYQAATTTQVHAGRNDIQDWITHGFIPDSNDNKAACDSLSYSFDDWAVGNLALAMGLEKDAATFWNRSFNYKNVWNSEKQLFCPKNVTGEWDCPKVWINFADNRYVEGDAWQWRWFVPHDPVGMISLFTSEEDQFILEEFFERSKLDASNALPNPYYWAGNEPDIFAAYLFVFAHRPDLTQQYVRWMMDNKYTTNPDGLPGNDDYGCMSAWFVWGALGLYPQAGSVDGRYIPGSPLFSNVTVHLPSPAQELQIIAYNNSEENMYVSEIKIDGLAFSFSDFFILHNQISKNTSSLLEFWMSNKPTKN